MSWLDATGKVTPLLPSGRNWYSPRFSPDGARLALDILEGSLDIWTYDIKRGSLDRLTLYFARQKATRSGLLTAGVSCSEKERASAQPATFTGYVLT